MRFDLLNQSIELNAGESPSLYNTLNMIRSLFQDVEDAADASLSQCPIGDEKLPLEMIWLSNELLSIYEDNSDALQRNRARLDSIMEDLRSLQDELEKIAETTKQLPEKEAAYQKLLEQLEAAREAESAYAELLRKIESAQKELATLESFDFEAARQKLRNLQEQVRSLEDEIRKLDNQIQTLNDEIRKLKSDVAALRKELDQELLPERDRLTLLKQDLENQKRNIRQQISDLINETNDLNADLAQLRKELPKRIAERDAAKQRVEDYRRKEYDPIASERDKLLETEKQLQADKASAEKQITDLTENQRELTRQISRKRAQYVEDNAEYEKKQAQERKLIQEQQELTRKLNKITDDLLLRQSEYDKLHDTDLPEVTEYLEAETKRRDELQKKVDSLKTDCKTNADKIQQLEKEIPIRQEELRKKQSRYEALTVTFTTNNKDILEMERQIRELEAKNDKERLAEYRTQLHDKQQQLNDMAEKCADLKNKIQAIDENFRIKNETCQTLQDLKQRKEDGLRAIEEMLEKLRPCSTPEYRRRAESIDMQFHTLQNIRNNLANSIFMARRTILGYQQSSDDTFVLDLEEYLYNAALRSHDIYQQLTSCANALKNHIMEEPK